MRFRLFLAIFFIDLLRVALKFTYNGAEHL